MLNPVTATRPLIDREAIRPQTNSFERSTGWRFAPLFTRATELAITTVDRRARSAAGRRVRARQRAALGARCSLSGGSLTWSARAPDADTDLRGRAERQAARPAVARSASARRGPRRILARARLPLPPRAARSARLGGAAA